MSEPIRPQTIQGCHDVIDRLRDDKDAAIEAAIHLGRRLNEQRSYAELLREALVGLLGRYVGLVNCGDCGNWDPEREDAVIAARAALAKNPNPAGQISAEASDHSPEASGPVGLGPTKAMDRADCRCTLRERESGHRLDCPLVDATPAGDNETRQQIAEAFIAYCRGQTIGIPVCAAHRHYNEGVEACVRILEDQL